MPSNIKQYPPLQFALFRILFGCYLFIHFLTLISVSPDIWSRQGMMGDASLNFTYGKFFNILNTFDQPIHIQIFIVCLTLLSLLVLLGVHRQIACVLLWYGWACLFHRNNLISNPGLPMIGWMFLAMALIPSGEPLTVQKSDQKWHMPSLLFWGAWWILGVSYVISGIDKLMAPSWRDGTAMIHLLNNPMTRDWFLRDWLLQLPLPVLHLKTWTVLALEISFGFLCLSSRTRMLAWFLIVGMHLGILMVIDFADLTIGVLMMHFFTFDPSWFQSKQVSGDRKIVLFDGVCGLCNGWVNFLIKNDRNGNLKYSALQGAYAKNELGMERQETPDSIIFFLNGKIYKRSKAIIMILRQLGGIWVFPSLFLVVPSPARDWIYDLVAKYRYTWFGKHEACRIPTLEERKLFVD